MERNILLLLILGAFCEWSLAHGYCKYEGTNTSKVVDVEICVLVGKRGRGGEGKRGRGQEGKRGRGEEGKRGRGEEGERGRGEEGKRGIGEEGKKGREEERKRHISGFCHSIIFVSYTTFTLTNFALPFRPVR